MLHLRLIIILSKQPILLVNNKEYFIINRPRQYGKTTTLYMFERYLNTLKEKLKVNYAVFTNNYNIIIIMV